MKVIFLDIDGVLNLYCESRDEYGCCFHQHLVDNLKRLIDKTGAKIVISSTWRFSGLVIMKEMWEKRNLPGEVVGITPNFMKHYGTTLCRGKEIDSYLEEHPEITNYVILDDDSDMEPHQLKNFVMTSGNTDHSDPVDIGYGLTKECTDLAIEILMR
jgi:hypothetical protein